MHPRIVVATLAGVVLALGCSNGNTNPSSDGGGGSGVVVRLGQAGESCARTADCADELVCVDQKCAASGTTPSTTRLSARGESCASTTDCASGLLCWPILSANTGVIGIGRCDFESFGITPTGKTCGAECTTNADCCELPIEVQSAEHRSCEDLKAKLGSTAPSACETNASPDKECFLYMTYCNCGSTANPWTCTNGACTYTKTCEANGETKKGCPTISRTGRPQISTCNTTSHTCAATAGTPDCTSDATCDTGKTVADDPSDTCSVGECVCVASSCYRRCANDLECSANYACDTTRHVCVSSGQCATDSFCQRTLKDINAKCVTATNTCRIQCKKDIDCNGSGLSASPATAFANQVCSGGYCTDIGCGSDAECNKVSGSDAGILQTIHLFCTTPPAGTATPIVHSAITN